MTHNLVHGQVGKAYSGPREALCLTGKFVLAQLLGSEAPSELATSPFVTALRQEVRTYCIAPLQLYKG